ISNENNTPVITPQNETQKIQTTTESSVISPAMTPTLEPWVSSSLWDGPVIQPPKELSASVSGNKDAIDHTITVTFNGGGGQQLIRDIRVRTILDGGQVGVSSLGKNKGDSIVIQGTNKTDRIEAAIWFMDNNMYKIYDQNFTENKSPMPS
ncbi:MAG: hypothetical protein V1862_01785, partial [Methanobacteriota archaeon]